MRACAAKRVEQARGPATLVDFRFRRLIGEADWALLPSAVQSRFRRLSGSAAEMYLGQVTSCRMSHAGRLLAQAARLIGAPLPLVGGAGGTAAVLVSETAGGQRWTRLYDRPGRRPQLIRSCKRFAGPTGLEEAIGGGFTVSLRVTVAANALHFISAGYCWQVGKLRLRLPRWLEPGTLVVSHIDEGGGSFSFGLTLRHSLLGLLVEQSARFREQASAESTPA